MNIKDKFMDDDMIRFIKGMFISAIVTLGILFIFVCITIGLDLMKSPSCPQRQNIFKSCEDIDFIIQKEREIAINWGIYFITFGLGAGLLFHGLPFKFDFSHRSDIINNYDYDG